MTLNALPQHRILSVMPTFQCTAECNHCGTLSSPREQTHLTEEQIVTAIDQASGAGYALVVFTGGEPMLARKPLLAGLKRAKAVGLSTRMVTNAYWAVTGREARRRIEELVQAGLDEINFSTGDQHARFVPWRRIVYATRAAVQARLPVSIMVEIVAERKITRQTLVEDADFQSILTDFPTARINVHESPWMPLSPRTAFKYPDQVAVNRSNLYLRQGCDSILATTTLQANGGLGACCGLGMRLIPELQLGSIDSTQLADADREASADFLKRWIRVEGPEHILAWAAQHDPEIEWEDIYAHRCQACLRLYKDPRVRTVIENHYTEKIADVLFGEWLLFHYSLQETGEAQEAQAAPALTT